MFSDARHAVRWAESRLSQSGIKSPMASMMKQGLVAAGDLSAEELDDIALTVTSLCNSIAPPKGTSLLAVFGISSPVRDMQLADAMVLVNRNNLRGRKGDASKALSKLSSNQHTNLMRAVIMAEAREVWGAPKLSTKRICQLINLTPYKYKKNHVAELFRLGQGMLKSWIDDAARQLEVELDARDLLSEQ